MNNLYRKPAVIFGAGGLAKELIGYIVDGGEYEIEYCVSTMDFNTRSFSDIYKVFRELQYRRMMQTGFLAIADSIARWRIALSNEMTHGFEWGTYIDPDAKVNHFARIGRGCVITPRCLLAGDCALGEFVYMNMGSIVSHDCRVGDFVTLMPNVQICGNCVIGEHCYIGIGAYILPGVSLAPHVKVSAGAVVRKSILTPGVTVYGDPAKEREKTGS